MNYHEINQKSAVSRHGFQNHELIHPPTDAQLNFNLLQKKTFFQSQQAEQLDFVNEPPHDALTASSYEM